MLFNSLKSTTTLCSTFAGCAMMIGAPTAHATCVPEPYIGSICITAATFCPRGYAEANGQLIAISDNQTLYSLIGSIYGGDDRTTFALPDLRSRTPVGIGRGTGLSQVNLGQRRGREQQILDNTQLPTHNHIASFVPAPGDGMQASTESGSSASPNSDSYLGKLAVSGMGSPPNLYTVDDANLTPIKGMSISGTITVENSGASQPFPLIPPQLSLRYCIATDGLYPPRS